jgi:RNA polymerase sigma-70 factor (ECF subfamily)
MSDLTNVSDTELIILLKESEHAAFTEIYKRYFNLLLVFVHSRLKDEDSSKDIVQELFLNIWVKRETMIIPDSLAAYLYTSVRNRMLRFIERNNTQNRHVQSLATFDRETVMTDYLVREKQLANMIEKEVNALPKRMREVFIMSRKANMTYKEISQVLDLDQNSVKIYAKHAIKKLRLRLRFN